MAGLVEKAVRERRSVRTYDDAPLSHEDRLAVAGLLDERGNPFGVPVEFRVLDAQAHGLKSPAIVGERAYVAAKVARVPLCELAYGYEFERFCLGATSAGLGTVMLAASLNRDAFERAMEVAEGEVMPLASPVGRPARRQSIREAAMRKAIGADKRLPFGEVFFAGTYGEALDPGAAGDLQRLLEAVRLAPSAANKQPWRVVVDGGSAHFYELHSIKENALGDVQRIDMGIAFAHFHLVAAELGMSVAFDEADPGLLVPEGVEYVMTCPVG